MKNSINQLEKNTTASFAYVKKDMLMLNDSFSSLHNQIQHLSMNHAVLMEKIQKMEAQIAEMSKPKTPARKPAAKKKAAPKKRK